MGWRQEVAAPLLVHPPIAEYASMTFFGDRNWDTPPGPGYLTVRPNQFCCAGTPVPGILCPTGRPLSC